MYWNVLEFLLLSLFARNWRKFSKHEIDNFLSLLSRILNIVFKFNIFLTAFSIQIEVKSVKLWAGWCFIVIHSPKFVKHWQIGPFIELLEDSLILSQIRFRHFKAEKLRSHKKLFLLQNVLTFHFYSEHWSYFKCIFRS